MDRGQRSVVARVHRLEHVEGFATTHFADHDSVRSHAKGVYDQVSDADDPASLCVGRPRLQADHVALPGPQLSGVLHRDDAFGSWNEAGEHVEHGGLSRSTSARDHDVHPGMDTGLEELDHCRG